MSVVGLAAIGSTTSLAHATAAPRIAGDYDGDGRTDIAVYRPSTGIWYVIPSNTGASTSKSWGGTTYVPAPGDYDGDGKTDYAVFRPTGNSWSITLSTTGRSRTTTWGVAGDIPAPGDYDGDGKTDIAVWTPWNGVWWVRYSTTGLLGIQRQWGLDGDVPVPGDYDGDGRTDTAVWRPSDGVWYIVYSSTGGTGSAQWGSPGDVPMAGDYDGDGRTDTAIWRPSTGSWWWIDSSTGNVWTAQWGLQNDIPVAGDYDGNGRTDLTVWRPTEGNWYVAFNGPWSSTVVQWGTGGANAGGIDTDIPLPNIPSSARDELAVPFRTQEQGNWCSPASTQMIAYYSGVFIAQCDIVNADQGRADCCTDAAAAADGNRCNRTSWWSLSRYGFTITDVSQLNCGEVCAAGVCTCPATGNAALSFAQLSAEISANRPVIFAWHWNTGGGHTMAVVGTWVGSDGTQWVTINDPGGSQYDTLYTNWVSGGNHTHWRDGFGITRQR